MARATPATEPRCLHCGVSSLSCDPLGGRVHITMRSSASTTARRYPCVVPPWPGDGLYVSIRSDHLWRSEPDAAKPWDDVAGHRLRPEAHHVRAHGMAAPALPLAPVPGRVGGANTVRATLMVPGPNVSRAVIARRRGRLTITERTALSRAML